MPDCALPRLLVACALLLCAGCGPTELDFGYEFIPELGESRASERIRDADSLEQLVLEDWDEAYAFGPYTARESISDALDGAWTTARMELDDSKLLIVFLKDGVFVGHVLVPNRLVASGSLSGDAFVRVERERSRESFRRVPGVPIGGDGAWSLVDAAYPDDA